MVRVERTAKGTGRAVIPKQRHSLLQKEIRVFIGNSRLSMQDQDTTQVQALTRASTEHIHYEHAPGGRWTTANCTGCSTRFGQGALR